MIGDAVWNLGGSSTYKDVTTSMFYERERGTDVYNGRPTEWTGKIGLMYPSDYGYATLGGSTTSRDICLNTILNNWNSSVSDCQNNDWLKKTTMQWTLTMYSSYSDYLFSVSLNGTIDIGRARLSNFSVVPALYLSSNVKISVGTGTSNDPFTLSL